MTAQRDAAIADFRTAVAGILNIAVSEISDDAKILLAKVLQAAPDSIRLSVALEPFTIVAGIFSADRSTPPVELFRIDESVPQGNFH